MLAIALFVFEDEGIVPPDRTKHSLVEVKDLMSSRHLFGEDHEQ
jgi:hypothetical protein